MNRKFHVKRGDTVYVNAGEYKGQQGRVLEIIARDEKAIVEGINMVSKHTKPNAQYPQGGIIKKEAPIHLSNLMIVDGSSGKPTRVGRRLNDKDKLVRFSKNSGEEIK
ncbi:MAG: 50S ribosomal protein L24 [Bacteroidales bacterium]|jgi:large subunit ribosomal protein L24|nr:50S ribosomal protein L24 [Bacteroidales bacterium]MCK5462181.1 50S ribosomal protein L24 [Bacteroidales bacterium]